MIQKRIDEFGIKLNIEKVAKTKWNIIVIKVTILYTVSLITQYIEFN